MNNPPTTPFGAAVRAFLWKVHDAAARIARVSGISVRAFVGAVPPAQGQAIGSSISRDQRARCHAQPQGAGLVYPVYGSAYNLGSRARLRPLSLAPNLFIRRLR